VEEQGWPVVRRPACSAGLVCTRQDVMLRKTATTRTEGWGTTRQTPGTLRNTAAFAAEYGMLPLLPRRS